MAARWLEILLETTRILLEEKKMESISSIQEEIENKSIMI